MALTEGMETARQVITIGNISINLLTLAAAALAGLALLGLRKANLQSCRVNYLPQLPSCCCPSLEEEVGTPVAPPTRCLTATVPPPMELRRQATALLPTANPPLATRNHRQATTRRHPATIPCLDMIAGV